LAEDSEPRTVVAVTLPHDDEPVAVPRHSRQLLSLGCVRVDAELGAREIPLACQEPPKHSGIRSVLADALPDDGNISLGTDRYIGPALGIGGVAVDLKLGVRRSSVGIEPAYKDTQPGPVLVARLPHDDEITVGEDGDPGAKRGWNHR
jgi:hypothetical protein